MNSVNIHNVARIECVTSDYSTEVTHPFKTVTFKIFDEDGKETIMFKAFCKDYETGIPMTFSSEAR